MKTKSTVNLFIEILSGTAGISEKKQFDSWINESKENRDTFNQFKIFWERSGKTYESHEFDTALAQKKVTARYNQKQKKIRLVKLRYRIAVAASIIFLLGLAWLFKNSVHPAGNTIQYSTLNNEMKEVILPDSSHVWLNANSNLQVSKAFNKHQRKVFLQGEAYFEVAHNKEKVFKVITGEITTRVLGTSFTIKAYKEDKVQIIVNTGKVEFFNKFSFKERKVFTAGSVGEYSSSIGKIVQSQNKNINYLAWKTGQIEFKNTSLKTVCGQLSEIYGREIIYALKPDSEHAITATFTNAPLEEILEVIELTTKIKFKTEGGKIIIYK